MLLESLILPIEEVYLLLQRTDLVFQIVDDVVLLQQIGAQVVQLYLRLDFVHIQTLYNDCQPASLLLLIG